jgi:hypothetical protein
MAHDVFTDYTRAYRHYDLALPCWVPGFSVGFAISKLKQIGVWDKLPHALKDKAGAAKGSWTGMRVTQRDLDSIPDEAWKTIAAKAGVRWRYAPATTRCDRGPTPAFVSTDPVVSLIPAT